MHYVALIIIMEDGKGEVIYETDLRFFFFKMEKHNF